MTALHDIVWLHLMLFFCCFVYYLLLQYLHSDSVYVLVFLYIFYCIINFSTQAFKCIKKLRLKPSNGLVLTMLRLLPGLPAYQETRRRFGVNYCV